MGDSLSYLDNFLRKLNLTKCLSSYQLALEMFYKTHARDVSFCHEKRHFIKATTFFHGPLSKCKWFAMFYFHVPLKDKVTPKSLLFCLHLWQVQTLCFFHSAKFHPLKCLQSQRNSSRKKPKIQL